MPYYPIIGNIYLLYAIKEDCAVAEIEVPSEYKGKPVKSIMSRAFEFCVDITAVNLPYSVESIGDDAFSYCRRLKSVNISVGVSSIGKNAFSPCRNLTEINVAEDNRYYKSIDGNLYTKDGKTLLQYAIGKQFAGHGKKR